MPVGGIVSPEEGNATFVRAIGAGGDNIIAKLKRCVFVRGDLDLRQDAKIKVELVDGA